MANERKKKVKENPRDKRFPERNPDGGGSGGFMPVAGPGSGGVMPWASPGSGGVFPVAGPRAMRFPNGAMRGLGWVKEHPDQRDADPRQVAEKWESDKKTTDPVKRAMFETHKRAMQGVNALAQGKESLPSTVDWRGGCSPVEDQDVLGSCSAHAAIGMLEYMERITHGKHIDASHLFLYKVTRNLMGVTGDTGGYLRTVMKALALFGLPPASCWPYHIPSFDIEPAPFVYSYAANYKALQYLRMDPLGFSRQDVLDYVRAALAKHFTVMFGFVVYANIEGPDIPFPSRADAVVGGHAVLAVGYDDKYPNIGTPNNGALIIRNSWGEAWGDEGYGYLPYDYVLQGLAGDFWTCLSHSWVDTGVFD